MLKSDIKKNDVDVDHFELLCDFGELNSIFTESDNINSFLHKIVSMVAKHMGAAACTIFLYDEETELLVLRAAIGVSQECVGRIKLKVGEGLTGLSLEQLKPIWVDDPINHPKFKHIGAIDETEYDAFLSVPITRGISKLGVFTLHSAKGQSFSMRDVQAVGVIASQLATIIENAALFSRVVPETKHLIRPKPVSYKGQKLIKGMSASDGYGRGKAFVLDRGRSFSELLETEFKDSYTLADFKRALVDTERQLNKLQGAIEEKLDDAASLIFNSHLLIIKDPVFMEEVFSKIESGTAPSEALVTVAKGYMDIFSGSSNQYVRDKVQDVEDLVFRIIGNLDRSRRDLASVKGKVVIARELYPSDMLKFSSEGVAGVIQVTGGVTSHIAILARSLLIPMIIVDMPELTNLKPGASILLDADLGNIYINPHPDAIKSFKSREVTSRHISKYKPNVKPETFTKDGTRVRLMANINLFSDLELAMQLNAEGVGLYRTEFPFLIRADFPSEEEQFVIYRRLVNETKGKDIVFRTLDIGGDKILSYYENYHEANPFLGLRSIRFSLRNSKIFKQQIRAMLRACCDRPIKIMFPMISSLDEFLSARTILFESRDELVQEGIAFTDEPQVGMMVEVPSLVEIMEELAQEADFFSLGTNDFIQYILGVDRTNEKVAGFYLPHHPSVLRSVKRIVDVARKYDKEITICGAMAHQPRYIPFLLGIGNRNFSMNAIFLPKIQEFMSTVDTRQAEALADEILTKATVAEIENLI